jgi:hypothetical protein
LKSVETFGVSEFRTILIGFLLSANFGGSFFLGRRAGFPLPHTTAHCAGNSTRACAFSSVTRDGTNGGTAGGTASSSFETATAWCIGVFGGGFLLGLFLFRRLADWSGSFRVDSGLLLRGTVAIRFVFELLIRALTILSKYKNADVLRG